MVVLLISLNLFFLRPSPSGQDSFDIRVSVDGKWLDNTDGTVYCGGECEFKVWDCSSLEPCSVQFTEILGIFTHESYSKPAFAYQNTVCQKKNTTEILSRVN